MSDPVPPSGASIPQIAHEWTRNDPRWPGLRDMTFCIRCGVVQRYDGKNKPCSGQLAPITLREQVAQAGDGKLDIREEVER